MLTEAISPGKGGVETRENIQDNLLVTGRHLE